MASTETYLKSIYFIISFVNKLYFTYDFKKFVHIKFAVCNL